VFALAASGTVSLELAACGTPHVITYKFVYLANKVLKYFSNTRYANLINILADKFIIPEFILENCHEVLITPVVLYLMQNPDETKAQVAEAQRCLLKFKPADNVTPSEKAAETVLNEIKNRKNNKNDKFTYH